MTDAACRTHTVTVSTEDLDHLIEALQTATQTPSGKRLLRRLERQRTGPSTAIAATDTPPEYAAIPNLSQPEAEQILLTARRSEDRAMALLALSVSGGNPKDIQSMLLAHFNDPDARVRAVAALGISHLSRLTGQVDAERVIPALRRLAKDNAQYATGMQEVIDWIESSTAPATTR